MEKRSFLSDFVSVGISKILVIFFGLLSTIIVARSIGPEGNGIIAALIVYPSLFMSFGSLGISQSVTYLLGQNFFSEEDIKRAVTQIWLFSSIVCFIVCYFLVVCFTSVEIQLIGVLLAILPIPFTLFNVYNSGIFLGKNKIKEYNKVNWIPNLITLLSNIIFVWIINMGVLGALISLVLGPFSMSIILFLKNDFLKTVSFKINKILLSKMLSLGMIYAFSLFIINLNYKVDIILLDRLSTTSEIGFYSKGAAITEYLWQIPMLFSTIVFARSAIAKNAREFSLKVTQLLRLSFVAIGFLSIILYFLSPFIIELLFGKDFSGSINVLKCLLPGVLILTIFKVMNMDLAGKGKPWIAIKVMIPALIINLVLNIWLIPYYGAIGAALASTISYSFSGLLFLFFYSKEVKITIKRIICPRKEDIVVVKKILSYVKNRGF